MGVAMNVAGLKEAIRDLNDDLVVVFELRSDRDPAEESFGIDKIETGRGFVVLVSED